MLLFTSMKDSHKFYLQLAIAVCFYFLTILILQSFDLGWKKIIFANAHLGLNILYFFICSYMINEHSSILKLLRVNSSVYNGLGMNLFKELLFRRSLTILHSIQMIQCFGLCIYFFSMLIHLDEDISHVIWLLFDIISKSMFTTACTDGELEVSHPIVSLIDKKRFINTSKKSQFLYVFHEISSPLKSISDILKHLKHCLKYSSQQQSFSEPSSEKITSNNIHLQLDEGRIFQTYRETILMMLDSEKVIEETLEGVKTLLTIEEKPIHIEVDLYSIRELLYTIQDNFLKDFPEVDLIINTTVSPEITKKVYGDTFCIQYIISILTYHYIRLNCLAVSIHFRAEIEDGLSIAADKIGTYLCYTIAIRTHFNSSSKLSFLDHTEINAFQPFTNLRHGENGGATRDISIHLAIGQELIKKLGGGIFVESSEQSFYVYKIYLPYEVSKVIDDFVSKDPLHQDSFSDSESIDVHEYHDFFGDEASPLEIIQ